MSDVTRILKSIEDGDPAAAEQLLPLVYDQLRMLAAAKVAHERPEHGVQATALVHEAYLRLVDGEGARFWNSRGHFFAAAAEAMRRILVEQARQRQAQKRGGGATHEQLHESRIQSPQPDSDVLAVHDALDDLQSVDPLAADLVRLRYFVGMSMQETADVLGMSVRSAHDIWAYARSWLRDRIRPD